MPKYQVRKSIDINAPVDTVRESLLDLTQWPSWSPWLCAEPDCTVSFHGTAGEPGHGQDWDGEVIGAGQMRLKSFDNERIDMDLKFLKPFKSQADVGFNLRAVADDRCEVEWIMDSSLPFFMFFLKGLFTSMIGADYKRGLLQLKDYIETGSAPTATEVVGVVDIEAISYLGTDGSSSIESISDVLGKKIEAVVNQLPEATDSKDIAVYTIYNKMNVKKQHCDFTAAVATTDSLDTSINSGFAKGNIEACKALKIVHTGEYRHLGNAWATGMMHMRAKKLKPLKKQPPFEKYISDPASTPGPELITEIYLPLR